MEENQTKTRNKPGARVIHYVAAAIINGQLIIDQFGSHDGAPVSKETALAFDRSSVQQAFYQKYHQQPTSIRGPFYEVKCLNAPNPSLKNETNLRHWSSCSGH
jgi:hypothetical protein